MVFSLGSLEIQGSANDF